MFDFFFLFLSIDYLKFINLMWMVTSPFSFPFNKEDIFEDVDHMPSHHRLAFDGGPPSLS